MPFKHESWEVYALWLDTLVTNVEVMRLVQKMPADIRAADYADILKESERYVDELIAIHLARMNR